MKNVSLAVCFVLATGCATIFKGDKGDVIFRAAPDGLKVSENGQDLPVSMKVDTEAYSFKDSFKDTQSHTTTTYYSYGTELKGMHEHDLVLETKDGQRGEAKVTAGVMWHWVVLDLFLTGPIGLIIDGVTGDWKEFYGPQDRRHIVVVPEVVQPNAKQASAK